MTAVEQRYVHQEKEWDVHLNHLLDDLQRAIEPYPSENGVSTNPYGVIHKTTENVRSRHPSKGYEYTEVVEPTRTTKYSSSVVYKSEASQNFNAKLPSRRDYSPDLRLNFDDDRVSTPLPTTRLRQNISELDDLLDGLNSARRQGFTKTTTSPRTKVYETQDGFRGDETGPASHSTPNASRKYDREAIRQVNQQVSRELQYRERESSPSRYGSRERSFPEDKQQPQDCVTTIRTYNTYSTADDTLSSEQDIEKEKDWYSQQPSRKSRPLVESTKGPKKNRKASPSPSRQVETVRTYTTSHADYPGDHHPGDKYPMDKYPGDRYPVDKYPVDRYPVDKYPGDRYPDDKYGSPPGDLTTKTTRTYYYTSSDRPGDNYPPQQQIDTPSRPHPHGYPHEIIQTHPPNIRPSSPGYPQDYPGPQVTTTTKTYYTYNKKDPGSPEPERKYPDRGPVEPYIENPPRPKQPPSPYDSTDPHYPKGRYPVGTPSHPGPPGQPDYPAQPGSVTTVRTYNYSYNYPSQPAGKPGSFPVDPSMRLGSPPHGPDVPKRLDDLMASISDSEDFSPLPSSTSTRIPLLNTSSRPHVPNEDPDVCIKTPANVNHSNTKPDPKLSLTKNTAGPAVYYPPKYEDTFTMKREECKTTPRWMMEQQAYSGSSKSGGKWKYSAMSKSKSSESSGGAVVPVCLPLCCAAPLCCSIM